MLRERMRSLIEQHPGEGVRRLEDGDWIIDPLWVLWSDQLRHRRMDRAGLRRIVFGYRNELRLWIVGERTWEQCVSGLAGRVVRRL